MNYAKLSKKLTNQIGDFIEKEQGMDCFNMFRWVEHCQNEFDSVEGGRIHAILLMQVNGWEEGQTTFKGMPILD